MDYKKLRVSSNIEDRRKEPPLSAITLNRAAAAVEATRGKSTEEFINKVDTLGRTRLRRNEYNKIKRKPSEWTPNE